MSHIPPYTSLDILHAMQREWFEQEGDSYGPFDGEQRSSPGREQSPDPIGLAIMRLRPIERMHALFERVARLAGRPTDAATQSTTTEIARVPDGVRDRCT